MVVYFCRPFQIQSRNASCKRAAFNECRLVAYVFSKTPIINFPIGTQWESTIIHMNYLGEEIRLKLYCARKRDQDGIIPTETAVTLRKIFPVKKYMFKIVHPSPIRQLSAFVVLCRQFPLPAYVFVYIDLSGVYEIYRKFGIRRNHRPILRCTTLVKMRGNILV